MSKQWLLIGGIFCGTLFLLGCGRPKSAANLYGTYVADYDVAREKLTLNEDGTFTQQVTIKASSTINITEGSWHYDPKSGYVRFDGTFMVVLDGFRRFDPNYAKPKTGDVVEVVGSSFGRITIGIDEAGIIYKKL